MYKIDSLPKTHVWRHKQELEKWRSSWRKTIIEASQREAKPFIHWAKPFIQSKKTIVAWLTDFAQVNSEFLTFIEKIYTFLFLSIFYLIMHACVRHLISLSDVVGWRVDDQLFKSFSARMKSPWLGSQLK